MKIIIIRRKGEVTDIKLERVDMEDAVSFKKLSYREHALLKTRKTNTHQTKNFHASHRAVIT